MLGHQTQTALQYVKFAEQVKRLDPLLEFLHGRQLDALLTGIGSIEWWMETPERMDELIDIAQRVRDDELGI